MSLLEQLAKQAEAMKPASGDGETPEQREANYKILEVRLGKLRDYWRELTKLLAAHKDQLLQRYDIPGYGTIIAQIAHDYEVSLNNPNKNSLEVRLAFSATILTEQCPAIPVQGVSRIQTIKALFDKHRIPALQDAKKDASGAIAQATFRARGKIPLTMIASSDSATGNVKLQISNYEDLGATTKQYSVDQFTEEFFDVIGHYVARKDNELTKEKLPDSVLKKLRHTAQQNEMRRRWEEKLAEQAAAAEAARAEAERQGNLGNRMIAQSKALFGKLGNLIKKKE